MIRLRLTDYRTLRELFALAAGPFCVLYTSGRWEVYAPKSTEAIGWIRTGSGMLEVEDRTMAQMKFGLK